MRLPRLIEVAALLTGAAAAAASPASTAVRVVGGAAIQIQAAPWSVFITYDTGVRKSRCTGALIDASHVVTAAHCVYGESDPIAQPGQLTVQAGVSSPFSPSPTDAEQDRAVASFRVHPAYDHADAGSPDDIAVLALASPLELNEPTAKALSLPVAGGPFPAGAAAILAGYGLPSSAVSIPATLTSTRLTVEPQNACGARLSRAAVIRDENATTLCAFSRTSATCGGDSGAALVTTGADPVLIGVNFAGLAGCPLGGDGVFVNVAAPEVLLFVEGDDNPPAAPRRSDSTSIALRWHRPLTVGGTVTCSAGPWPVPVRVTYVFRDAASGTVLRADTDGTYVVARKTLGKRILCEARVTSGGGTLIAETSPTTPVKA